MTKKLFLGISLDEQQRREIAQLQDSFDSDVRLVPISNLHITLAFFGLVSSSTQRKLEKRISALHKPPFRVTLDQLSHWKKPKILCLTGETKDKGLLQIAKECQLVAADLDLPHNEHIFRAHITVARKAHQLPQSPVLFKPLLIKPREIHLFESKSTDKGGEYRILRSWFLH